MSAPKRVLLLDTGNEWGGGTNSMFELLKRIDRTRFDVTCCFYKDYKKGKGGRLLSEELAEIGIPLILLPSRKQPLWAKLAKELARGLMSWSSRLKKGAVLAIEMQWRIKPRVATLKLLLEEGGYDLLYMNNQPSSNLEGYLAAEAAGLPVVQHCRSTPALQTAEVALVNRTASLVVCVSRGVADVLATLGVSEDRLRVVYNAIDSSIALPAAVNLDERLVIGTVGRLNDLKSVDHLIRSTAQLVKAGISVHCVIVGEGEQSAALKQLAISLGVEDAILFVGFQSAPLAWVQAMDVCVLCSSNEGLPRVVLEAMLARKPVVGSDVNGTRELIIHEETGLLYHYGNVLALTKALLRLLSDPSLRQMMGEAGRRRVETDFSIEAYVTGVTNVLAEVLE